MTSISKRISRYVLSAFSIVFLASMIFVVFSTDRIIAQEAEKTAEHTMESIILEIENSLLEISEDTKDLYLNPVLDDNSKVISYKIVDVSDETFSNQDWFRLAIEAGKPIWTEPYVSAEKPGTMVVAHGYPFKNEQGEIVSVAMTEVKLDWISSIIREDKFKPYKHSATSITSAKNVYLGSNFEESRFTPGVDVIDTTGVHLMPGKKDMGYFKANGKNSFFVSGCLENGWNVLIISLFRDVFEGAFKVRAILLFITLLAFILFSVVLRTAISSITRPLRSFTSAANQIAKGNFDAELPNVKHDDEVKELKNSFDYLQTSLTSYIQDLQVTTAAKERLESELSIAHKIQQDLLPSSLPVNDNVMISALLIPAKEVGGDLYDFSLSDDVLHFSVGDVSGKGIPASLLMSSTQSAYRFNKDLDVPLDLSMERINNYLSEHSFESMFVTMFIGNINLKTYKFDFCNAGHNRIVICPPEGDPYLLKEIPNFVLGIIEDFKYVPESIQLEKGTSLILYSDGVTEAENCDKELYGEERLLSWAAQYCRCLDPQISPATSLLRDVQLFTNGNEQNDDITIVFIRI